jgi:molybdopterin-containing oxidoreductase family iron-sulfur binding subunit
VIERREFLKSLGLTGSALALERCAPAPTDTLIPYLVSPDDITPGVATHYATSCRACPAGCGMLAKVVNGRTTKVEGNPNHPISRGHLCARGQASVQSLYNPDRFGMPRLRKSDGALHQISWDEAESVLAARLRDAKLRGPDRIAWLGGLVTGSLDALTAAWLRGVGSSRRLLYEPFDYEPLRVAGGLAFGRAEVPRYDFDRAEYLLAFGAEFLETWISNVEFTSAYAGLRRRRLRDETGSFTWIAPRLSLSGLNSDGWIPVRPGSEAAVALALAHAIIEGNLAHPSASTHLPWISRAVSSYTPDRVQAVTGVEPPAVRMVARQFASTLPSLAVGGGVSGSGERHAIELEVAVLMLNVLAGNVGQTVNYGAGSALDRLARRADIAALTRTMADGGIDVLLVHHTNPVLTLPPSLGFADALQRVPFTVTFSNTADETSEHAHLILPDHHFLESWGDYSPRAGIVNLLQPAAAPLLHSRATGDVLISVARQVDAGAATHVPANGWEDYVRTWWLRNAAAGEQSRDEDRRWSDVRRSGGRFEVTAPADVAIKDLSHALVPLTAYTSTRDTEYTLVTYPSPHVFDGRDANEAWLREVPDPVTKIAWNGWLEIHPDAARRLGIADGDTVDVQSAHGQVEATCHLYRGLHADAIAMPLGFGRSHGLRYARHRGANGLALLSSHADDGDHATWTVEGIRLRRRGPRRLLTVLQADAPAGAPDRSFAQIVNPAGVDHRMPSRGSAVTLYPPHTHAEHRWGMAIDLNACTGCDACVVACYAENNVPVVGELGCAQGREMAWIRIERHEHLVPSEAGVRRPASVFLPMLCQHCDHAPCEAVCPVYATYHNPEGLNAQVYARCIGTRFCSNNCPYKVRRFNFAQPAWPGPLEQQLNPDVTVRSAGVMEKCTFCIQRIQTGKNDAKRAGRPVRDGDIVPACAQTCPADAIVFGDLQDPSSRVSRLSAEARGYHVLDELNTRPAITYLRRSVPGAPHDSD